MTNRSKNKNEDEKIRENDFEFWIFNSKIRLCDSFHENLRKTVLTHFRTHFLLIEGKLKVKIWKDLKRFGKNEFDFWIFHIKTRLYRNFHENLRKNFLTYFLSHFLLIEAKMKMKIKKFGKVSSIFKLCISKFGYIAIFMKICFKIFWPVVYEIFI